MPLEYLQEMHRENLQETKESNKALIKEVKELSKATTQQTLILTEVKNSLQELQKRPCVIPEKIAEINKGWKDTTVKKLWTVIATLFTLLAGVLAAFGLYKPQ